MKSAYEKALERFGPVTELSAERKAKIAEITRFYQAKIAETELAFKGRIQQAPDREAADQLQKQMRAEITRLQDKAERDKAKARETAD